MASDEEKLRQAASEGSSENVKNLLEKGTKQTANDDGEAPLHLATSSYVTAPEYVEIVRSLLDHNGDVNSPAKDGNMPIHNASANGNMEIVELLLDYGAALDAPGEGGRLPLELAASKKHHAVLNLVVKQLIEKKKFTAEQTKWMSSSKDTTEQLTTYRALGSICQIKEALPVLIGLNIVDAIIYGLTKFDKRSVLSHGLQLLQTIMKHPDGLASMKVNGGGLKERLQQVATANEKDAVISHLVQDILKNL